MTYPYKEYSTNQITTASQANLIVLMYEGAIRHTRQALESIEGKDAAGMAGSIQRARDILNELSIALDVQQGKDAARRLESIYQFAMSQLTLANIKAEGAPLEAVIRVLTPLLDAWTAVAEGRAESALRAGAKPVNTHG